VGRFGQAAVVGALGGAAGTTALNAVTYLDMTLRARPPSSTPEDTVQVMLDRAGVTLPGDEDSRRNRLSALGALSGIATGVGVGVAASVLSTLAGRRPGSGTALALGAAAMAASDSSMTSLGVTDPRTWRAADWAADIVPHLAYGAAAAGVLRLGAARGSAR